MLASVSWHPELTNVLLHTQLRYIGSGHTVSQAAAHVTGPSPVQLIPVHSLSVSPVSVTVLAGSYCSPHTRQTTLTHMAADNMLVTLIVSSTTMLHTM